MGKAFTGLGAPLSRPSSCRLVDPWGERQLTAIPSPLCAEAALALLEAADGPEEIDLTEGGPVGVQK